MLASIPGATPVLAESTLQASLMMLSRPEIMADFLEKHRDYGVKITLSQESEPLGTAGPLALAQELLDDGEPFFVLNCDIACEFNLRSMLDFHRAVRARMCSV